MEKKQYKKNGELELLRFLFAIMVLFYHTRKICPIDSGIFKHGYFGVEFFFILSGALMAKSIYKRRNSEMMDNTFTFIFKKIKSLFSYHTFSFILSFIIVIYIKNIHQINDIIKMVFLSLPEYLLIFPLSGFQYNFANINAMEWYISAMLLGMLIMYPLMKKNYDFFIQNIAPIFVLFGFGYIFATNNQNLNCLFEWNGIVCTGLLRAISELSLGCLAFEFSRFLSKVQFTNFSKTCLTILKYGLILVVFYYMNSNLPNSYEFILVYFLAMIIALSMSNVSYLGQLCNHPIIYYLGRLSLPLYLFQGGIRKLIIYLDLSLRFRKALMLFTVTVFIASIVTCIVIDIWNKFGLSLKFKKLFVLENVEE